MPASHRRQSRPACALAAVLAVLVGCAEPDRSGSTLRISVLPDQAEATQRARFGELVDYLADTLGVRCELVLVTDYEALLRRFEAGEFDVARLGGLTYLKAEAARRAIPLVMRDVDLRFTSYFLSAADAVAGGVGDLRDTRFGFGSRLSTSGHLMPRYFLERRGIAAETYFADVHFTGAHDRVVRAIAEGNLDAGVANAVVVDQMLASEPGLASQVKILERTPPYADYVWAARAGLPRALAEKFTDALLALSPQRERDKRILAALGADHFLPANANDFDRLRGVAERSGLLN